MVADAQDIDPDPTETLPDEEMLALGMARYEASMDLIRSLRDNWKQWDFLYRNYVPRSDWPFDTNLHIPAIFSTIESFLPRLVANRPRIKIDARNDEDIPTARVHRELMDYQWDYVGMNLKMVEMCKSGLTKGTAVGKLGWMRITQAKTIRRRLTADNGLIQQQETTEDVRIYDDPIFDLIDLENFLIDPDARSIESARYAGERHKLTLDEIEAWMDATPDWPWKRSALTELQDAGRASADADTDTNRRETQAAFGSGDPEPNKQRAMIFEFEVIEYWEDQRMAVFVRSPEILLLQQKNPYWHQKKPFVIFVDNLIPGSIYGMGEAELLESMNIELDDIHNLRLEAAKRNTMKMYKVRRGSPPYLMDIKFVPQGKIPVNQPDDITPLIEQDVAASGYREEDMLRLWIQETSGNPNSLTGLVAPVGNETATGASLLAQTANARASVKFLQLVEMTLLPMAKMWISLNEQYIDQERVIRVVGPEGDMMVRLAPEDVARSGSDLDVKIDVGATDPVNRELKLQRSINALQVVAQIPPETMGSPQVQTILARIFDLLDLPPAQAQAPPAITEGAEGQSAPAPGNQTLQGEIGAALSTTTEGQFGPTATAQ
jgi:hypothetical protein